MTNPLDALRMEFTCPQCSHGFTESLGRLADSAQIACPACRFQITLDQPAIRATIQQAKKGLTGLFKPR